jgi:hypothetical protein
MSLPAGSHIPSFSGPALPTSVTAVSAPTALGELPWLPLALKSSHHRCSSQFWIEDRENPARRNWLVDRVVQQVTGTYKDYTIMAGFTDGNTDHPVDGGGR